MNLYKRDYEFLAFYSETYYSGVGILSPEHNNYIDLFANGYIKVVDEIVKDKQTYASRVCTCKVNYTKDKAYITHRGKRYFLDNFIRVYC